MDESEFERLVDAAFAALPEHFRTACGPLVVRVDDFAAIEVLEEMEIDDPYDLLGLYQGVGLPFLGHNDVRYGPDVVSLYRLPILDHARCEGLSPARVVRHVLVHEIGHHFGFSDDDMEAIEDAE
jgi:predicted Zn-dependent protease with MMP-like domain